MKLKDCIPSSLVLSLSLVFGNEEEIAKIIRCNWSIYFMWRIECLIVFLYSCFLYYWTGTFLHTYSRWGSQIHICFFSLGREGLDIVFRFFLSHNVIKAFQKSLPNGPYTINNETKNHKVFIRDAKRVNNSPIVHKREKSVRTLKFKIRQFYLLWSSACESNKNQFSE